MFKNKGVKFLVKECAMCKSGTLIYFVVEKMVQDLSFYIKKDQTVVTIFALIKVRLSPYRAVNTLSVIQTSQLMLYREIIAVCSQIHTKHINTVCVGRT